MTTSTTPPRTLALDGALNFRDLGGYPTIDGRMIRWRTLFRSDGLAGLTPGDLELLRAVEIKRVIDLRTAHELEERGRFPVEQLAVSYHHVSVLDTTWGSDDTLDKDLGATDFLRAAYRSMLVQGAARFAESIELLAEVDALPAVFHCAAGKDRTGVLALLLLGALGVPNDVIVEDYALTELVMPQFIARMQATGPDAPVNTAPRSFFTADGPAMALVIGDLEADHGSVRNFVRHLGVGDDAIDHLAGRLLVG